jgi:hypothetical protein
METPFFFADHGMLPGGGGDLAGGDWSTTMTTDLMDLGIGRCRTTRWSIVFAAAAGGESASAALGQLFRSYWGLVFAKIARGRAPHAAQELTQEFFVKRLVDGQDLKRVKRQDGKRFRGWLSTAVESFLNNRWDFDHQQCRDVRKTVALSFDGEDGARAAWFAPQRDPEQELRRARAFALLTQVLGRLRREYCAKAAAAGVDAERRFEVLKVFLPGPDTEVAHFRAAADALGLEPGTVRQVVQRMKGRFAELLDEELLQHVDAETDLATARRLLLQALEAPLARHEGV